MRAAILTKLRNDATLSGILTGGVFDHAVVGALSLATAPAAFDATTKEIKPSALLRLDGDRRDGPLPTSSRLSFTIYLYERASTTAIEPARLRIYALLHRVRLVPASGGAWIVQHGEDILDQRDPALRAFLIVSRYSVYLKKG